MAKDKNNTNKKKEVNPRLGKAGGQALIEGIMMNGPGGAAMSVRQSDGTILTVPKETKHIRDKVKFLGIPIIRGVVNFIESMVVGYKCLMESAELSGQMELEETEEEMSKVDKWISDHFGPKMMAVISAIAMVLGVLLAFVLFIYLPVTVINLLDNYVFDGFLVNHALRPLCEGVIRIVIYVIYLAAVSKMKDIKRVFMYHGAEHKTIFCYEAGEELTVENVKKYKRFHPRCGTSFMFLILIISILLSSILSLILSQFPNLTINGTHVLDVRWAWSLIKILILPLVMGFGYEFLRYAGRHDNAVTRFFSAPGLWMQRLTTKEPDDDMIEVGIAALKAVIGENEQNVSEEDQKKREENADYFKQISLFGSNGDDVPPVNTKAADNAEPAEDFDIPESGGDIPDMDALDGEAFDETDSSDR
ncbi:MAG: DUF1385 domain-containing protein [Clostridiales bacterium]|nr:DUF1385 domain-containing protein [Clostridiales bacterium]